MKKKKVALKDKQGFTGEVRILSFKSLPKPSYLPSFIWEEFTHTEVYRTLVTAQKPLRELLVRNLIVSSNGYGRNLIMRQLGGDTTYGIEIDSAKLGDGTTPPANTDTDLENVLKSGIAVTQNAVANNVLTQKYFLVDADLPDDTYEEFGTFIGAQMFSRALTGSYSKSSGEDTLIQYTITAST